jgi:predicted phosphodiesterase
VKIAVFGDVHGNLPAFEKMIKEVRHCDEFICLGDLVNYGPWSNECVDLSVSLPFSVQVMGNHEEAFINGFYPGNNVLVQSFFNINYEHFKRFDQISKFQQGHFAYNYSFQHTFQNSYIYPDTKITLDGNYVIGHSHHQFVYRNSGFTLYNAGSVGQNRHFINVINYLIFDTETLEFELKALTYDVDLLINELKHRKFPDACINYYNGKERL